MKTISHICTTFERNAIKFLIFETSRYTLSTVNKRVDCDHEGTNIATVRKTNARWSQPPLQQMKVQYKFHPDPSVSPHPKMLLSDTTSNQTNKSKLKFILQHIRS